MIETQEIPNYLKKLMTFRIVKWFFTVGIGLIIDLIIFYTLSSNSVNIFLSSLISSGLAITFVYFSSIRYVFQDKDYAISRYILFILYYAISISFFSFMITILVYEFSLVPLVAKIVTLPCSFLVNYFFASKIV